MCENAPAMKESGASVVINPQGAMSAAMNLIPTPCLRSASRRSSQIPDMACDKCSRRPQLTAPHRSNSAGLNVATIASALETGSPLLTP